MILKHKFSTTVAALAALLVAQAGFAADGLVDSASFEYGGGDNVKMVRFGVQSDWDQRWFASNGRHLSGYWDATIAQWRGDAHRGVPGQHQDITNIGFTPVFRYQRDDKLGWYVEGGIGLNLLSRVYDNGNDRLSTAFQFGDHLGIGYVLDKKWDIGLKYQHFSNGGIKKPNSGVDFILAKASYRF
jgi:lipid A 3-O-deacylase